MYLHKANLSSADLHKALLGGTNLSEADLNKADLSGANLSARFDLDGNHPDPEIASVVGLGEHLVFLRPPGAATPHSEIASVVGLDGGTTSGGTFGETNLTEADLVEANLNGADLTGINLTRANLHRAYLNGAILTGADLTETDLTGVDFSPKMHFAGASMVVGHYIDGAILKGTNFRRARMTLTTFGNIDLRQAKGLDEVDNYGISSIGIDTIFRSEGQIPEIFLQGAGVPNTFISYMYSLVNHPLEYYTAFISYSSQDQAFAERLYADLRAKGVRCWFASEDMKIGDKIRPRIDESIRMYDKLLLVLSQHSMASKWVEYEVEAALEKEQEGKPPVLFPVRLDNTVMESTTAWAAHIKRTRHIGDFTQWKNHDDYQKA